MLINPISSINGAIDLPGDKSISHRAAIFSALAEGESRIENFADNADCSATLSCLERLGVEIVKNGDTISIKGRGKQGFNAPSKELDCGNSGTTMRLLSGVLAGQEFTSILTGDESLSSRPMKRVIEPLTQMGAEIVAENESAPLTITGRSRLNPINYEPKVASAQVKSCILLAGLNAEGTTSYLEKIPTRDHTERMLRAFGVEIGNNDGLLSISGDAKLSAVYILIPADISSASFFLVAASCLQDSDLIIRNVGLNPSRAGILEVLKNCGANIEILNCREACNEPIGDLRVKASKSLASNGVIKGGIIANIIDEIPILAIFGSQIEGGLEIREAGELRIKESDRISAVVENLRKMGADIEEYPDGFKVNKSKLKGAEVDSYGDHRIAMAFSIAALFAEGETKLINPESAKVSFPQFFDVLRSISK